MERDDADKSDVITPMTAWANSCLGCSGCGWMAGSSWPLRGSEICVQGRSRIGGPPQHCQDFRHPRLSRSLDEQPCRPSACVADGPLQEHPKPCGLEQETRQGREQVRASDSRVPADGGHFLAVRVHGGADTLTSMPHVAEHSDHGPCMSDHELHDNNTNKSVSRCTYKRQPTGSDVAEGLMDGLVQPGWQTRQPAAWACRIGKGCQRAGEGALPHRPASETRRCPVNKYNETRSAHHVLMRSTHPCIACRVRDVRPYAQSPLPHLTAWLSPSGTIGVGRQLAIVLSAESIASTSSADCLADWTTAVDESRWQTQCLRNHAMLASEPHVRV